MKGGWADRTRRYGERVRRLQDLNGSVLPRKGRVKGPMKEKITRGQTGRREERVMEAFGSGKNYSGGRRVRE